MILDGIRSLTGGSIPMLILRIRLFDEEAPEKKGMRFCAVLAIEPVGGEVKRCRRDWK